MLQFCCVQPSQTRHAARVEDGKGRACFEPNFCVRGRGPRRCRSILHFSVRERREWPLDSQCRLLVLGGPLHNVRHLEPSCGGAAAGARLVGACAPEKALPSARRPGADKGKASTSTLIEADVQGAGQRQAPLQEAPIRRPEACLRMQFSAASSCTLHASSDAVRCQAGCSSAQGRAGCPCNLPLKRISRRQLPTRSRFVACLPLFLCTALSSL